MKTNTNVEKLKKEIGELKTSLDAKFAELESLDPEYAEICRLVRASVENAGNAK